MIVVYCCHISSTEPKNYGSLHGIPNPSALTLPRLRFFLVQVDYIRRQDPSKDPTLQEAILGFRQTSRCCRIFGDKPSNTWTNGSKSRREWSGVTPDSSGVFQRIK